jgi:hypothetical protein
MGRTVGGMIMDRLSVYRELAEQYDRLGQVSMRDRFLILAADAALEAGEAGEAERMRLRLLQGSRHHMLRPYHSFAEAALAGDVQTYLHDLRTNYPPDVAQQLLDSLKGSGPEENPGASPDQTSPVEDPPSWPSTLAPCVGPAHPPDGSSDRHNKRPAQRSHRRQEPAGRPAAGATDSWSSTRGACARTPRLSCRRSTGRPRRPAVAWHPCHAAGTPPCSRSCAACPPDGGPASAGATWGAANAGRGK